jgi:hypothetical protein
LLSLKNEESHCHVKEAQNRMQINANGNGHVFSLQPTAIAALFAVAEN